MSQVIPKTPEITIQAHPKERGLRPPTALFCGCSCCCCCCLHSIGGLAGAIAGSGQRSPSPMGLDPAHIDPTDPDPKAVIGHSSAEADASLAYWAVLVVLTAATVLLINKGFGLIVALMCLPVIQLAASAVTAIYLSITGGERSSVALRKLGRITWLGFLGSLLGAVIMTVLFLGMVSHH